MGEIYSVTHVTLSHMGATAGRVTKKEQFSCMYMSSSSRQEEPTRSEFNLMWAGQTNMQHVAGYNELRGI